MTSITFNTLAFTKRLQEAGFDEEQAETVVNVLVEAQDNLVTSDHFDARLDVTEARIEGRLNLIQWMLAAVVIAEVIPLLKTLFS
jgi:LDH2 family malate/lactate/ureidoglycolate dehydrogenase